MAGSSLTPVGVLSRLFKIDPASAKVLFAGIGVFAAAAIVAGYNVDFWVMLRIGVILLVLGVVLVAVARLPPGINTVLGGAVVALMIVLASAVVLSMITNPSWPKPTACIVYPLQPCEAPGGVQDQVAERQAGSAELTPSVPTAIPAPTAATGPGSGQAAASAASRDLVFIQFAGPITRESVRELNASLRRGGWRVQSSSGERTEKASGLNEVRYRDDADLPFATALADAVTRTGIASAPVGVRQMDAINADHLELWISRN